jgi:hypothetical protein
MQLRRPPQQLALDLLPANRLRTLQTRLLCRHLAVWSNACGLQTRTHMQQLGKQQNRWALEQLAVQQGQL